MKTLGIFVVIGWIFRILCSLVFLYIVYSAIVFITDSSKPPSPDKAQYGIQTYSEGTPRVPSRVYYADKIEYQGNLPVVPEYWKFDGENYKRIKEERIFTEPIKIVRRNNE